MSKLTKKEVEEAYAKQGKTYLADLDSAPLKPLVGLLTLMHSYANESLTYIEPLVNKHHLLCPTNTMTAALLSDVYDNQLLNVDVENSLLSSFVRLEGSIRYYTYRTAYKPAIYVKTAQESGDFRLEIVEAMVELTAYLNKKLTLEQKMQLPELMHEIAVQECVQYMEAMLEEYGFKENLAEKTEQLMKELVQKLPVTQIFPCIWGAVKSAAAFLQTTQCKGYTHAYNTIHSAIIKNASKRELSMGGYDRPKNCGRSEISIVLYELLGYDGDAGFTQLISEIDIPESLQAVSEEGLKFGRGFTSYEASVLNGKAYYEVAAYHWERPIGTNEVRVLKLLDESFRVQLYDLESMERVADMQMDDFSSAMIVVSALLDSERLQEFLV